MLTKCLFILQALAITADVLRVPIWRPKTHLRFFTPSLKRRLGGSVKETLFDNVMFYQGNITVGTPKQQFTVDFDTGSHLTWLVLPNCTYASGGACTAQVRKYQPGKSSTSKDLHKEYTIQYGRGFTQGGLYQEQIAIGNASDSSLAATITLLGASNLSADFRTQATDGLVGLSFAVDGTTSLMDVWASQHALDGDVFTVWLTDRPMAMGGEIIFGGTDPTQCGEEIVRVTPEVENPLWSFTIDNVFFDDSLVATGPMGLVDTGTTQVMTPAALAGLSDADCAEARKHKLTVQIGGANLTLQGDELVVAAGSRCISAVSTVEPTEPFILGDAFIRKFCLLHYVQTHAVGFAPNLQPH